MDMVSLTDHPKCSELTAKTIKNNVGLIIDLIYEDVVGLKD